MNRRTFIAAVSALLAIRPKGYTSGDDIVIKSWNEPLIAACNRIIRNEWNRMEHPWRQRATIKSVPNFHPVGGAQLDTYGRMFVCHPESLRKELTWIARNAALALCKITDTISGPIEVAFLHGYEPPLIDAIEETEGGLTIRVVHDFGVCQVFDIMPGEAVFLPTKWEMQQL